MRILLSLLALAQLALIGPASSEPLRFFAYRSFRPKTAEIRKFADIGVNTVCFYPANTDCSLGVPYSPAPPIWVGPGQYDFATLEAQVQEILAGNPNAQLLCLIDLNTPLWWTRLNCRHAACADTFYKQGQTLAHEPWREDTAAWVRAFLAYMQAHHGERMAGYALLCGGTTEWLDHSQGMESPNRRAAWRRWMQAQGQPDPVDIPVASVRERAGHGLLRDPQADALALAYWRFHHWLVTDSIEYVAKAAQEVLDHRVPLGCFFGYVFELGNGRLLYEGHLNYDALFRSVNLDFFMAPGTYADRAIGEASGFMGCLESMQFHGKSFLHEIDHRTWTSRSNIDELGVILPGHEKAFPDAPAAIAGLRREFALALIEGTSLWWFDMFGGWYEGAGVRDAIGQMKGIWDRFAALPAESASEVAVVVDPDSLYYLAGHHGGD